MPTQTVSRATTQNILGNDLLKIIEFVAAFAEQQDVDLYLVGGIVRDILLEYPSDDVDFMLAEDAIAFTEALAKFGGTVTRYPTFGTATWHLEPSLAEVFGIDTLPIELIDFAQARTETYEHSGALPTVRFADVYTDLERRDFSVNAMALHVVPKQDHWQLLDQYNGFLDLQAKQLRVMHPKSFQDDPTRVLRGIRFINRFGFTFSKDTHALISSGLASAIQQTTGTRLRNELSLLMAEPEPERSWEWLAENEILHDIHPKFSLHPRALTCLKIMREQPKQTFVTADESLESAWHILLVGLDEPNISGVMKRLLFADHTQKSVMRTAAFIQTDLTTLDAPTLKPSEIDSICYHLEAVQVATCWYWSESERIRDRLQTYWTIYRHVKPSTTGETLKSLGIPPGPIYREILQSLRRAKLDGKIDTDADELAMIDTIWKPPA